MIINLNHHLFFKQLYRENAYENCFKLVHSLVKDILVIFEFALGIHSQVTGVTVVTEGVGIMPGLHMVPCAVPGGVRKLVTKVAVEPSILLASAHKLIQITGI